MKNILTPFFAMFFFAASAQTKYYSAVSDNKAVKDIVIAFEAGLKIDELGGTNINGTVTYNTGKNDKEPIALIKLDVAVDEKGHTGERKYYDEVNTGGKYIITEWPMQTIILYITSKGKKYTFYCQNDYNFSHDKPFGWYKD